MLVSCTAAAREADPAGMSSGEPSATEARGRLASQSRFDFYSGLVPALQAGQPAAHVLTIRLVLGTKFPAECWFFIQDYEQVHAESNCCDGGNREQAGVSEDNPQPEPARCERLGGGVVGVRVPEAVLKGLSLLAVS
jgi:hypothetical protein